jgi:hypothetical protein
MSRPDRSDGTWGRPEKTPEAVGYLIVPGATDWEPRPACAGQVARPLAAVLR